MLCHVDENNCQLAATGTVLTEFPHSQNCPVIVEIGKKYHLLRWIHPTPDNYERFVDAVISSTKKNILGSFRKEYTPG